MTDTTASDPFELPPESEPSPAVPHFAPDDAALSLPKIAVIAALAAATILPNMLMSNLIEEREARQEGVRQEFTKSWGPEQSVYTPTLIIPYQTGGDRPRQYVKVTPARFDLVATIDPQERRRGLFHATVYDTRLEMQGAFVIPSEGKLREFLSDKDGRFLWDEGAIAFGTAGGLAGMRPSDNIRIDGTDTSWQPCLEVVRSAQACGGATMVLAGVRIVPVAAGETRIAFRSSVNLRGTSSLALNFAGKELTATMRSSWPNPSFAGDTLPTTSTVTPDGFEGTWQATELGSPRVTASTGLVDNAMWKGPTIRVDLIEATPIYRMINRVAKYGLLFVLLSFATYFFFEVLSRLRIHVVQYGLLALSLSLFSLLLLSLAEPIGYTNGYLVSAGLVLAQSTLYTAAVARRVMATFVFAVMLASLFGFLYVLLGLETYSLLIGALALFVVVSALMVLTQMVDLPGRLSPSAAAR